MPKLKIRKQCLVEGILCAPDARPTVEDEDEVKRLIDGGFAELDSPPKSPAPSVKKGAKSEQG